MSIILTGARDLIERGRNVRTKKHEFVKVPAPPEVPTESVKVLKDRYKVVLARHNDERHYVVDAGCLPAAITDAFAEWCDEFGEGAAADLISIKQMV